MKQKANRCEYGHINAEKRKLILGAVLMVVLALAVFFLGLALNKWEKRNIFSVLAVLFVLPWARYVSTLVIMLPFRTPAREQYEKVQKNLAEGVILISDYVFSSKESVMGLSFLVLTGHELIGLTAREKEKPQKIQEYMSELLKRQGIAGKVTIYDNEAAFLKKVSGVTEAARTEEEMSELFELLRSMAV